jgi:hypothetical protein
VGGTLHFLLKGFPADATGDFMWLLLFHIALFVMSVVKAAMR